MFFKPFGVANHLGSDPDLRDNALCASAALRFSCSAPGFPSPPVGEACNAGYRHRPAAGEGSGGCTVVWHGATPHPLRSRFQGHRPATLSHRGRGEIGALLKPSHKQGNWTDVHGHADSPLSSGAHTNGDSTNHTSGAAKSGCMIFAAADRASGCGGWRQAAMALRAARNTCSKCRCCRWSTT